MEMVRRTATAASSSSSPDWLSLAKWCAGCAAPTQQSDYSKGQRKQPAGRRRCRRCMDAKTELKSFAEIREILDKNAQALAEWRERMERQRGNSNLLDQLPADSFGLICDVLYRDDPPWLAPRTRLELADEAESDDPGDEDYDDGDDRGSDDGGDGGSDGGSNGGDDAGSDSSSDAGSGDGSDDGGAGAECAYAERRRTDHEAALRMCGRLACVSRAARALVTGWSAAAIEHRKMHIAVEPGMAYARAALKHKARAREDEDANEDVDADGISRGLAGVAELDGIVLDSTKAITLLPGPGLADYLDRTTCDGYEGMRKEFGRLDHNGTVAAAEVEDECFLHVDHSRRFDPLRTRLLPRLRVACPLSFDSHGDSGLEWEGPYLMAGAPIDHNSSTFAVFERFSNRVFSDVSGLRSWYGEQDYGAATGDALTLAEFQQVNDAGSDTYTESFEIFGCNWHPGCDWDPTHDVLTELRGNPRVPNSANRPWVAFSPISTSRSRPRDVRAVVFFARREDFLRLLLQEYHVEATNVAGLAWPDRWA